MTCLSFPKAFSHVFPSTFFLSVDCSVLLCLSLYPNAYAKDASPIDKAPRLIITTNQDEGSKRQTNG
jgi:hypothetical protein